MYMMGCGNLHLLMSGAEACGNVTVFDQIPVKYKVLDIKNIKKNGG